MSIVPARTRSCLLWLISNSCFLLIFKVIGRCVASLVELSEAERVGKELQICMNGSMFEELKAFRTYPIDVTIE